MAIITEWLPIATWLSHHQLYFMVRYCLQNLTLKCWIDRKLFCLFDA